MLLTFVEQIATSYGKFETGSGIAVVNVGQRAKPATGSSEI
jgi:hypothetical protein